MFVLSFNQYSLNPNDLFDTVLRLAGTQELDVF